MLLVLLVFLVVSDGFAIFTNETLTITSFPNITKDDRYIVSSYQRSIYADFPILLSPFDQIIVYGTKSYSSFYVSSADNIIIKENKFPFLNDFSQWRIDLSQKILDYYPKSGALVLALILGNRNFINDDFMEYIRFSGLAHVMALSGLHLVIFVGMFVWIFKVLGVTHRYLGMITMPFSVFYLFLGGFGIPLQRAVLFHFLGSCYQYIRVPIPAKNIFLIAFLVNVVIIPNNVFTVSFWLSYISVLGIVFCFKFWYDMLSKGLHYYIASSLAVSLSACVMIAPILIWFFGYINIFAVVASLIVMPMIPLVLVLCFLVVFLSIFSLRIDLLDNAINLCYYIISRVAQTFSNFGVIFFEDKRLGVLISLCMMALMCAMMRHYEKME